MEKGLQLRQHVPHLLRAHTQIVPGFAQHGVRRHDDHIRVVDGVQRRVDVFGALQAIDEVRVHHPQAADQIGIIPQGVPEPGQQADQIVRLAQQQAEEIVDRAVVEANAYRNSAM